MQSLRLPSRCFLKESLLAIIPRFRWLAALEPGDRFSRSPISGRFQRKQLSGMGKPLFYHKIQFSRLGGRLPEKVGSYVVGIPTEPLEQYRKEHPTEGADAAFRNLISEAEMQRMRDSLGFLNLTLVEWIPFDGEPGTLENPTFVSEGKRFWRILQSS